MSFDQGLYSLAQDVNPFHANGLVSFDTKSFLIFSGVSKETSGMKWVR